MWRILCVGSHMTFPPPPPIYFTEKECIHPANFWFILLVPPIVLIITINQNFIPFCVMVTRLENFAKFCMSYGTFQYGIARLCLRCVLNGISACVWTSVSDTFWEYLNNSAILPGVHTCSRYSSSGNMFSVHTISCSLNGF